MARTTAVVLSSLLAGLATVATEPQTSPKAAPRTPEPKAVQIEMKNVRLHLDEGIVLDVERLRGVMTSTSENPPVFDDQKSYVLTISTANVSIDMPSLQNLMNNHAFGYDGAPLKDVKVAAKNELLEMRGKLRKGLEIPFSTKATVGATDDGKLRLHAESMKAIGLPAKGLLNLFGLELDDLIALKQRRGIDVRENDIVISPGQVLPPPEIRGYLRSASIRGNRLFQTFGSPTDSAAALKPPAPSARNYVYFSGGDIRFGKLTMHEADLQLIDSDPRDPFDFFPNRYNAQLVAGYSKNTPQHGLKTFMPDYDDLRRPK